MKQADLTLPDGRRYTFTQAADGIFSAPAGRYEKLVRNGDGTFDLTLEHSASRYHFGSDGALLHMTDDYGNSLIYTYDTSSRLQRVADTAGSSRYLDVFWGADGRLSSIQDHTGRQVGYSFTVQGALESVTNPLGQDTPYGYVQGRFAPLLSAQRDNWNRLVTTITYDSADRVQSYTEHGETWTYTYSYQGNPLRTAKSDSHGNTWIYSYLSSGLITNRAAPLSVGGASRRTDYYPDGLVQMETDEVGVKTHFTYDAAGRLISLVKDHQGPNAVRFDYSYDPSFPAQVTAITPRNPATGQLDPNWAGMRYEYYQAGSLAPGALHRSYRVRDDGTTLDLLSTREYNGRGQITAEINALGGRTDYQYDAKGDLVAVLGPPNNDEGVRPLSQFTYDDLGQVLTATDALDHVTSFAFDALGRVVGETPPAPVGSALVFTTVTEHDIFDAATGLVYERTIDPNGMVTQRGRDEFGRERRLIDAKGSLIRYDYSGSDLISAIDPNGNVSVYHLDGLGRVQVVDLPEGNSQQHAYWPDGQTKSVTERDGRTITYTYDRLKRLQRRSYSSGGEVTFVYLGQKLVEVSNSVVSPPETYSFEYDSALRADLVTQAARGALSYSYTSGDLLSGYGVSGGPATSYDYYPDGSLRQVQWTAVEGHFKYFYDLAGRYAKLVFPNGQERQYSHDAQGRLTGVANVHPGGNLATFVYGYDRDNSTGQPGFLGLRTSVMATVPAEALDGGETRYHYDAVYQLTGADYPPGAPFAGASDRWTYDPAGNRTAAIRDGATDVYTYLQNGGNPNNGRLLASAGPRSFTYDANGRTSTATGPNGALQLEWNQEAQLIGVTGSVAVSYGYDYAGRRTSQTDSAGTVQYVFDGLNVVAERGGSDVDYLFGPSLDEPLAMARDGQLYLFSVDGLGSVVVISDADGEVATSRSYGAWGDRLHTSGASVSPVAFTAREWGQTTGLYNLRQRYLDPSLGRLLTEDPEPESDPLLNMYRYVQNRPTIWSDPLGASPVHPTIPRTPEQGYRLCLQMVEEGYSARKKYCDKEVVDCVGQCRCPPPEGPSVAAPLVALCVQWCRIAHTGCRSVAWLVHNRGRYACQLLIRKF